MADWIEEHDPQFELLVEASKKPEFYLPSISLLPPAKQPPHDSLAIDLMTGIHEVRQATRYLIRRAMLQTGSGQYDAAWKDLTVAYRLSEFLARDFSSMDTLLVRTGALGLANAGTAHLLSRPDLPGPLARQILGDLSDRPEFTGAAQSIDQFERMVLLDAIVRVYRGERNSRGDSVLTVIASSNLGGRVRGKWLRLVEALQSRPMDWNVALREANGWCDRAVEAWRARTCQDRVAKVSELIDEFNSLHLHEPAVGPLESAAAPDEAGRLFSKLLAAARMNDLDLELRAESRTAANNDMTRLSAALAVYRSERGDYPSSLDALTPGVIAQLPRDPYSNAPYVYRQIDDGYLLYSSGPNGIDDGGNMAGRRAGFFQGEWTNDPVILSQIPDGADDISLRMEGPAQYSGLCVLSV